MTTGRRNGARVRGAARFACAYAWMVLRARWRGAPPAARAVVEVVVAVSVCALIVSRLAADRVEVIV